MSLEKDTIRFGKLGPGGITEVRTLPQSAITACPHVILDPGHYREDNSCKCNDREETIMAEWGYVWNDEVGRWT